MPRSSRGTKLQSTEDVFQALNRRYIRLNKKETCNNNKILYSVLERILKLMKDSDELFKSMKPRLEYMGSYFDGLRVGHPTEFDINLVLRIPVNYDTIKLNCNDTQYDHTYIIMPSEFRRLYKNPVTANKGFLKTAMWCDPLHRLSVGKFRSWVQSVVDAALYKLPIENGKRILTIDNISYGLISKLSGPANNITIYLQNNMIDIDLVPSLAFELPKKPVMCKVDFSKKEFIKIKQYFVVPKPTDNDLNWRLSFPFQERLVLQNQNNLKCVVKLLKQLRDVQGFTSLASYYIKTLFLWEVSVTDASFWKSNSLTFLVIHMLVKFTRRISSA
ncbi:cyclic GMP-AMP synthase-like receptor isoform X2 [Ostrinia nubilalis]